MEYIALDVHKKYTWARVENGQGDRLYESRLQHAHGAIKNFVHRWSEGSPVAVETVGNWYWWECVFMHVLTLEAFIIAVTTPVPPLKPVPPPTLEEAREKPKREEKLFSSSPHQFIFGVVKDLWIS